MALRIMVVNDTQEILELFEDILGPEGYEVVLYSFAITDMDEIVRIKPDLIILDLIFGFEKSGWQMLQKLKMVRTTATIPVIVCTAATREVNEIQGYLQAKGVSLVAKPFDIDELLAAIKRALELHPHEAEMIARSNDETAGPSAPPGTQHGQPSGDGEKLHDEDDGEGGRRDV